MKSTIQNLRKINWIVIFNLYIPPNVNQIKMQINILTDTSTGDEDTEDELEYSGESRATTLPRGMQSAITAATNSLPRLPASTAPSGLTTTSSTTPSTTMHKAHSVYHFLPQHSGVKSARYRPPGFARNSNVPGVLGGPKRAVSAPGLQVSGSQSSNGKRDNSRSRRQQTMSLTPGKSSLKFSLLCIFLLNYMCINIQNIYIYIYLYLYSSSVFCVWAWWLKGKEL